MPTHWEQKLKVDVLTYKSTLSMSRLSLNNYTTKAHFGTNTNQKILSVFWQHLCDYFTFIWQHYWFKFHWFFCMWQVRHVISDFLSFMILYNYIIPISLYVTVGELTTRIQWIIIILLNLFYKFINSQWTITGTKIPVCIFH